MDYPRSDELARAIYHWSRRGALRLLAGAAAGFASWVNGGADAATKKCRGNRKKCGKRCIPKRNCCRSRECLAGQRCASGRCRPRTPGELNSGDASWTPCGASTGPRYFETYAVSWPGGPFRATMTAPTFRSWIFLFQAAGFDPANPCQSHFIGDAATMSVGGTAQLNTELPAGRYALVATNVYGATEPRPVTGAFTIEFGNPGG